MESVGAPFDLGWEKLEFRWSRTHVSPEGVSGAHANLITWSDPRMISGERIPRAEGLQREGLVVLQNPSS